MKLVQQSRTFVIATAAFALLAACVTINVYFPEAAATKAADSVVCEVLGTCDGKSGSGPSSDGGQHESQSQNLAYALLGSALNAIVPAANAQADLDVNSPGARNIRESMERRQQTMQPFLASGAIGFTNDGLVDVRDLGLVSLPQRALLRKLVSDENADRRELYAEIARVNGHPEWTGQIQAAFAERWVARAAGGWYYQNASGNWVQK